MEGATIYDPLRRKQVARTPEEEVRQAVIAWLRDSKGVPETRMESEWGFSYNRRRYRADVVVFNRNLQPLLLVECKAPEVRIDEKVIEQVVRYTRVLPVQYILITNGTEHYVLGRSEAGGFVSLSSFPELLG